MKIIIDTREQKPLTFTGHKTTRRKLNEGDYNIYELIDIVVIERKSLEDLCGSITSDHKRFKKEILRAANKNKMFFLFIEGSLIEFYSKIWSRRELKTKPETLKKIIETMQEKKYFLIIECKNRLDMSQKILTTLEIINENNNR